MRRRRGWEEAAQFLEDVEEYEAAEASNAGKGFCADHHGLFVATSATLPGACEKLSVLSGIQKDLFYAVG